MTVADVPIAADAKCDRCGARAFMRVTVVEDLDLHFCAHHAREHGDALKAAAMVVVDETSHPSLTNTMRSERHA